MSGSCAARAGQTFCVSVRAGGIAGIAAALLVLSATVGRADGIDGPGYRGARVFSGRTGGGRMTMRSLKQHGPRADVLRLAFAAYRCGRNQGLIDKPLLTVIDYSLPADTPRLWVIDVSTGRFLFEELVAHGRGSGDAVATAFSNEPGSLQSSLGLFRTEHTYQGRHGHSLNLVGLEPGVNDRAYERRIVVHGADYVTPEFIAEHGRLGRSWGCPALDPRISAQVIERIKEGSALFAYYPDRDWLDASRYDACNMLDAGRGETREPTEG